MSIADLITVLRTNRHLESRVEVAAFDKALNTLALYPRDQVDEYLIELFLIFDDSTKHREVMWGLLHYIEDFEPEQAFKAFGEAVPVMIGYSTTWARTYLSRILNSETARAMLKRSLPTLAVPGKTAIRQILEEISDSDAEKKVQVQLVLGMRSRGSME